MIELADYLANHYGTCTKGAGCICLKPGKPWLGTNCQNWRSWRATDWSSLKIAMRNSLNKDTP